jgi:4-amino-4-deoxychorismate lyase
MSLLIESVKLLDGKFHNLFYHEQRMRSSLEDLCGVEDSVNLEEFLGAFQFPKEGLYKCRIVYDDVNKEVEFIPYVPKRLNTLKIVEDDDISYEYKYKDREEIDKLFLLRADCDDILIIKDDHVTDSSFSNIVFKRKNEWVTPWSALLRGTMRHFLLDREIIKEEAIRKEDIPSFESFKLVNAMLGFEGPELSISNIIF